MNYDKMTNDEILELPDDNIEKAIEWFENKKDDSFYRASYLMYEIGLSDEDPDMYGYGKI